MSGDLTQALRIGQSGLLASQHAVDAVARNVANVNTPGYSRKVVNLEHRTLAGAGAGVAVGALTRRLDQGLLDTVRRETGGLRSIQAEQGMLERVQDLFGTPESNTSLSHLLSSFQSAIESLAANPADGLQQREVVRAAVDMASLLRQSSADIQRMRSEADQRISSAVAEVNRNLEAVADLNDKIVRNAATGQSVADLQDSRDQALDRLSELLDVRVSQRTAGDVVVFTAGGRTLVDNSATSLSHVPVAEAGASLTYQEGNFDGIYVGDRRTDKDITSEIGAGELAGLIKMRDATLPDLQSALDELAVRLRDTVNAVHNRGTSLPGLASMTGSRVFTEPASQTITFGGTTDTALVLLDANGQQVRQTTVRSLLGGASTTIDGVAAAINGWLGADGSASIVDGRLTIAVSDTSRTLALRDQATGTPGATRQDASIGFNADAAGGSLTIDQTVEGFSAFFGLNDFFVDDTPAAVSAAASLTVREDIVALPGLVARAALAWDANQAPSGAYVLASGDASIAHELATTLSSAISFSAAGRLPSTTTDLADYAATLIGDASSLAADTKKAASSQEDMVATLRHKSDSARGVNLDEELSDLMLYQQSYAAAARVIQTVQSMFDVLDQSLR